MGNFPTSSSSQPAQPKPPYPGHAQPQTGFNGARPRTTNPLYKQQNNPPPNPTKTFINYYTEVERSQTRPEQIIPEYETRLSYEAETLRADTKLTLPPPYYNDPYSDNPSSQRSSQAEPFPPAPPQRGYHPLPQSRDSESDVYFQDQPSSHAISPQSQSLSPPNVYHHQNDSTAAKPRSNFPEPNDSTGLHSMGTEMTNH